MREQQIQTKIRKRLESEGWSVIKLIKTSMNGIPDLMCLKDGVTMFVEVKQEKGKLSTLQKERIYGLRKKGFTVHVWTDYATPFDETR